MRNDAGLMNVVRILLADHEPASRLELETLLGRWGFEALALRDGRAVQELLQQDSELPPVLLLDAALPRANAFELTRQIRARPQRNAPYILLMVKDASPATVAEVMNVGADDYVVRPVQAHELRVRLNVARRIVQLQGEMHTRAGHDQLTGLWNHAMVLEIFQVELKRAERDDLPISLLLADVDHLKQMNRQYGHQVGDEILRGVAERMRVALRSYDLCGRYGGEEFMVVLPRCGRANAMEVANRVCKNVAEQPLDTTVGPLAITLSCGVATTARGQTTASTTAIIKAADEALFRAKRNGRNCVEAAVSIT